MSSYNYGMNFGYDQILPDQIDDLTCYSNEISKKKYVKNNMRAEKLLNDENKMLLDRMRQLEKKESLQNYLESSATSKDSQCECSKSAGFNIKNELDGFRKTLDELQRKNDMLTIFIIFLVIFVILQFNSSSVSNSKYLIPITGIPKGQSIGESVVAL